MKRLLAMGALLVGPMGCVGNQGDAFIRFLENKGSSLQGGTCTVVPNTQRSTGLLDLAGVGPGQSYQLALAVETNVAQPTLTVNQKPYTGAGLNDITVDEIEYSYEIAGESLGITLRDEVVPRYSVFRPGTDPSGTFIFVHSLAPGAIETLRAAIPADNKTSVIVLSTIKARAYLSSGQRTESNVFTFPTTVKNSGFSCPPPGFEPRCGSAGQDGTVSCASAE